MPTRVQSTSPRRAPSMESRLDTWHRLHDAVPREPVKVHHARAGADARVMADRVGPGSGGATGMQEMLDGLEGAARSNPFWPALQQMGVTPRQAHAAVSSLQRFDETERRTSLTTSGAGTATLEKDVKRARGLAGVVDGLLANQPLPGLLKGLEAVDARVLTQAQRLGPAFVLHSALTLLENRVGTAITDSPTDLLEFPQDVQRALESSIRGRTRWLQMPGADPVDRSAYVGTNGYDPAFGHLRELAVLDPGKAQTLGKAFVAALQAASVNQATDFNPRGYAAGLRTVQAELATAGWKPH